MHWSNLNSDILKNIEIQIPLDVYQEETSYPTNLSFPKNKNREKKLTNTNDYQTKLVENKENDKYNKENNIKNLNIDKNKFYIQTTLVDYGFKLSKNNISGYMSKLYDKKDLIKKSFYSIFGVDVIDKKEDNKLFIEPTRLVSYVDPICPICGRKNIIKYGPDDRTLVKKNGNKGKYKVQGYMCKDYDKTFFTSLNNSLNSETREDIELNEKIKKLHRISGLSLDKMAQIVGIFEDVSISHTSV
jgi:transposase-like protein